MKILEVPFIYDGNTCVATTDAFICETREEVEEIKRIYRKLKQLKLLFSKPTITND